MNIEKCRGVNCPIKDRCFHYVAPEDPDWQDWGNFSYDDILQKCIDFWPIQGGIQNDV